MRKMFKIQEFQEWREWTQEWRFWVWVDELQPSKSGFGLGIAKMVFFMLQCFKVGWCVTPRILVNSSGYVIEFYVRIFARMARIPKFTFLFIHESTSLLLG